jgi:ribosomal protein L11 methyltransferase
VSWALVAHAAADDLELLSAHLFELGAAGVELQEPGMMLMPGTPALPAGMGRAIAHFEERGDADEAARELSAEAPFEVPQQDWSVAWRAHHRTLRAGPRSWVRPPWEAPRDGVEVVIDPGMAFGTGSHATTSLCLERTDELLAERPGASLLDVGTGSGVIALLAKKLGAGRVVGTENDPVALQAAREGEALNGVRGIEWLLVDPDDVPGTFDLVIANILLNTLVELAGPIAGKVAPRGRLVLSGLLTAQADEAERAYVALGLRPVARKERDGWVRVELERA